MAKKVKRCAKYGMRDGKKKCIRHKLVIQKKGGKKKAKSIKIGGRVICKNAAGKPYYKVRRDGKIRKVYLGKKQFDEKTQARIANLENEKCVKRGETALPKQDVALALSS